jgi:hypothetical protein
MSQAMSQNENATPRSSVLLSVTGRGERIRTSDLTVPDDMRGKYVSICLFESCSHQGIRRFLHSFPFFTIRYRWCAENSVHKLATGLVMVVAGL